MNSIKSLSNRELDVLACVAARCSNKETAKLLNISPRTAETHVRHILIKIGCFTREAAIDFLKKTDLRDELQKRYEKISQTSFFTKIDREKHIRRTICAAATVTMLLSPLAFKIFETGDQTVEERGYFMRRKSIDKQIEAALCKEKRISIIVLIGCGGAGKTALARKHLLKLRADFKFEINADAENSILNSMFDLADKLATDKESKEELKFIAGIPNEIEKRKKLLNFIQNRMKKLPNWAIILDNLEDLKYLKEFCPNNPEVWGTGKVIITTRNENIKTVRYLGDIDAISVGELEEDEKAELFESVSGIPPNKETANFLKQIPGYPLDVFTAACYIKISGISLSEYLKRTSEISDEFVTVSKRLMAESLNYDKTRYGIVTSNFREILSKNKSFGELLLLICLFDSQKIPLKILRQMSGAVVADNLISYLKQYSVVSCDGDEASIHRSVQSIGLDYLSKEMRLSEKSAFLKKAISICAPYDCLKATYTNSVKLIPHLKAFLEKMDKLLVPNAERYKTLLLITIGDIYRFGECASDEPIKYFNRALEIGKNFGCLSKTEIASIYFKIGVAYSRIWKNDEAMRYASQSLTALKEGNLFEELALAYCTIGIINMRNDLFDEAKANFKKAAGILDKANASDLALRLAKVCVLRNEAVSYFTAGNVEKSIEILKKIVATLMEETPIPDGEIPHLIACKARLAMAYNAIGEYDLSLKEGNESETLVERLPFADNGTLRSKGIVFLERGVSHLRLGDAKKAFEDFERAKKIFSRVVAPDYLRFLKIRESEALIRLNREDEALKICEEILVEINRECNYYSDLIFNACRYHAALINYRKGNLEAAKECFKKFFSSMKELCKKVISEAEFEKLVEQNAFEEDQTDMKKYFENSLKVFKATCGKNRGFIKGYVEENLKSLS